MECSSQSSNDWNQKPTLISKYKTYFESWLSMPIEQVEQADGIILSAHAARYLKPKERLVYRPLCAFKTDNALLISCIPEWETELQKMLKGTSTEDAISLLKGFAINHPFVNDESWMFYGLDTVRTGIDTSGFVQLNYSQYEVFYNYRKAVNPFLYSFLGVPKWTEQDFAEMVDSNVHFCVIDDSKIVCATESEAIPNKPESVINLGVNTLAEYRRKGYASSACMAFIQHQVGQGALPVWQCDFDNYISQALAQKLGFRYLGNVFFIATLAEFWKAK